MFLIEERDTRFYLAKSTIPNAGMGVFTKETIQPGDRLPVLGIRFGRTSVVATCTDYSKYYRFLIGDSDAIFPTGFAGMINHAPTPEMQNSEIAHFDNYDLQIIFTKMVKPGEEVFNSYGEAAEWIINKGNPPND